MASDPVNEPLDLTVNVSIRLGGEDCTWNAAAGSTQVRFSLPGGMYGGQSIRRRLHGHDQINLNAKEPPEPDVKQIKDDARDVERQ